VEKTRRERDDMNSARGGRGDGAGMRPASVTEADLARYEVRYTQYATTLPEYMRIEVFREMFFAGEWLGEQLAEGGVAPEIASSVCFAHGQHCAMGGDPWQHAGRLLADALAGRPEEPGFRLAQRLVEEAGLADDFDGLLTLLVERGESPEDVDRHLDCWREFPHYPNEPRNEAPYPPPETVFPNVVVDRVLLIYRRRWKERTG
jgi:hypothetical protein